MKTFQIVISQGNFDFASSTIVAEQISFEQAAGKTLATVLRHLLIAKEDHKACSRKKKDGTIVELRPKVSEPFEVYVTCKEENSETKTLIKDEIKFNLTADNFKRMMDTLPKRLWLLFNEHELMKNPLLAFQPNEYYKQIVLNP